MCVCMYVRRPAAGHTQPSTLKFGMGSSFHPGSAPSQGATQNVGPQGYLPYWPRLKFPEGLRIRRGPANKSCSSGWVCYVKFYLWGAHPNHGPAGSTLPNGGICFEISGKWGKQKLLLGVGLHGKILFVGAYPNPRPTGSTPPKGGICIENWKKVSKQKLIFGVGLHGKILFVGGSPQPGALRVHPAIWGYKHLELREGQQTKIVPLG
jgi:hypothetical protein